MAGERCLKLALGGIGACLTVKKLSSEEMSMPPVNQVPPRTLVIGGGIIGLSTALRLAQKGSKVTVLESSAGVATVASYCNGAILCQSMAASWASSNIMIQNPGELKSIKISLAAWTDLAFYKWAFWFWFNSLFPGRAAYNHESQRQLAHYSLLCMEDEEKTFGDKLSLNKTATDTLKLFHNEKDMEKFLASDQAVFWKERGWEFERLSAEECYRLEPSLAEMNDLVGGVLSRVDSSGDIHIYCKNLEKMCAELGVDIQLGKKVNRLEMSSGEISCAVLEDGEVLDADAYVVAAGIGSPTIAATVGVNLPVYPLKGHIATATSREGEQVLTRNIYSPKHGLISPLAPNKLRVSGGVEAVGHDHRVEGEKARDKLDQVIGVFKEGFVDLEEAEWHSCLRPVCGDDVAIIGRTHVANLFVNTGHGSKGWTFSWGSSALLADIVCGGETHIDPRRFSPLRFHPVRKLFTNQ